MKKFTSFLMMAFVALTSLSLTSCDEDADIADTLYGTWKGYMDVGSQWDGQYYEATTSEITFNTDGRYTDHGDGYWIDRYSRAPWDYVANHIQWQVRNGTIRVYFEEEGSYVTIRDYSLDNDYFYGTLVSGDSYADFRLVKTASPSRWNYYWYGTDSWYDSWDDYYGWSKEQNPGLSLSTRSDERKDSIGNDVPKLIRRVHGGASHGDK